MLTCLTLVRMGPSKPNAQNGGCQRAGFLSIEPQPGMRGRGKGRLYPRTGSGLGTRSVTGDAGVVKGAARFANPWNQRTGSSGARRRTDSGIRVACAIHCMAEGANAKPIGAHTLALLVTIAFDSSVAMVMPLLSCSRRLR